ncbi:DUF2569 domain-containing protein [Pantoea sp. B65]|uniref:DUF2569 domain-containing protein n=1 Tax=Pantoea sp. B65 TaxID=2813359 RepID=UPI0039B61F2F
MQCIKCENEAIKNSDYCQGCEENAFKKIGGFLYIPAVSIVLSICFSTFQAMGALKYLLYPDNIRSVIPLIIFEFCGWLMIAGLAVYTAGQFFRKRRKTPGFYISLLVANLLFCLTDLSVAYSVYDVQLQHGQFAWLGRNIIGCAIWISYFLVSVRVKRTFVR